MELVERIFLSFFQSSLTASVVILMVILILKIFNKHLSIRVKNALWILVLIKLLVPIIDETNTNLFSILYDKYENIVYSQSKQGKVNEENFNNISNNSINYSNIQVSEDNKIQKDNNKNFISCIFKIASCIWLIGILALTSTLIIASFNLKKNTKNLKNNIGVEIITLVKECRAKVNIKSRIPLYAYDGFKSPCTLGIIKPKIYVPNYILNIKDNNKLSHIFLHELMHYKRKDLFYNFLSIVALLIHWFNPLVWFAIKKMKLYRECACDASVLELLSEEENAEYGMTLLSLSKILLNKGGYSQLPVFFETRNQIKDRIWMIKEFKKGSYRMTTKAVLGCVIAAIVIFTNNLEVKALNAENIIQNSTDNANNLSSDYNTNADSVNDVKPNNKINIEQSGKDVTSNDNGDSVTSAGGKWVQDNGKWYYYNNDGVMLKNTIVNGYVLGEDGALIDSDETDKKVNAADKTAAVDKGNDAANKLSKSNPITENIASSSGDTAQNKSSASSKNTNK